jgi:hypothetical protein
LFLGPSYRGLKNKIKLKNKNEEKMMPPTFWNKHPLRRTISVKMSTLTKGKIEQI